jgi:MFS family permease
VKPRGVALRLLPPSAGPDVARLVLARMVRCFADGAASVLLPAYLSALGYSAVAIGVLVTATLLGCAALTLAVGLFAHRVGARALLLAACALMLATGVGFAGLRDFAPLLLLAFVGTLNPTAGDLSVFLPIEQSLLAARVDERDRTAVYARSNVAAAVAGALGALASSFPVALAAAADVALVDAMRAGFLFYAAAAGVAAALYARLDEPRATKGAVAGGATAALAAPPPRAALGRDSRRTVLRLAALFTLDSFGGGFVVQSLLALWLFQRFGFSLPDAAAFFFVTSLLAGFSQAASPVLARRIGLVPTMVYTHAPANAFLVAAAFAPSAEWTIALLLLRMTLSSMDVPARQAFVMAAVRPEERAAAASLTNVPRSLGGALAPLAAGWLLARSTFGWPLVIGGVLKLAYDFMLLWAYRRHDASRGAVSRRPNAGDAGG